MLLRSACPLVAFHAMEILKQMLYLSPPDFTKPIMANSPVCRKLIEDSAFMEEVLRFAIVNSSPSLDTRSYHEWMAYGMTGFFGVLRKSVWAELIPSANLPGTDQ